MSDLLSSIKMLFENGWKFFTQTDIPGTGICSMYVAKAWSFPIFNGLPLAVWL